ncbi:MAG: 7-carboxy-7-deazaguanine synthase QueE [Syntrophomonadaceae bacterium]|nr:7-carboxy-7-deazaguanine synthase QueE [Syntrophomonadaceae bacterium]MDD3023012.1 7-carboxy-7-deazaguanine synthase QueE [Syntrophomonadaceae bacterium]
MKAELTEIMESIQGEGLLLGTSQVFLRFAGCNLKCIYCDTLASREPSRFCSLYCQTGSRDQMERITNPLSIEDICALVQRFSSSWISLTGGEPLLWAGFIAELMAVLKPGGYKFLLETNGTLEQELERCLPFIDMLSMDFKLPSATACDCWDLHQRFLLKARDKPCYVKIVITADTAYNEISTAAAIIKSVDKRIPLILQPVTPFNTCRAPGMDYLLELQKTVLQELQDVRIIPQIHPFMRLI